MGKLQKQNKPSEKGKPAVQKPSAGSKPSPSITTSKEQSGSKPTQKAAAAAASGGSGQSKQNKQKRDEIMPVDDTSGEDDEDDAGSDEEEETDSDVEEGCNGESGDAEGQDSESDSDSGSTDVNLMPVTEEGFRVLAGVTRHDILQKQPLGCFAYEDTFATATAEGKNLLEAAKKACIALKTSAKGGSDEYSAGDTYWIGARDEPKTLLEKLAQNVFWNYIGAEGARGGVHILPKMGAEEEIVVSGEGEGEVVTSATGGKSSKSDMLGEEGRSNLDAATFKQVEESKKKNTNEEEAPPAPDISFQRSGARARLDLTKAELATDEKQAEAAIEQLKNEKGESSKNASSASGEIDLDKNDEDDRIFCIPCDEPTWTTDDSQEGSTGAAGGEDVSITLHAGHDGEGRDLLSPLPAELCGAEYWAVVVEDGDNVDLHFDKDYVLEEEFGVNLHPLFGSVLYLTDGGAPTVVTGVREEYVPGKSSGAAKAKAKGKANKKSGPTNTSCTEACFVSYPSAGKHLVFDGQLLHFADPLLQKAKPVGKKRIALLVNLWVGHRPVDCKRHVAKANKELPAGRLRFGEPGKVHVVAAAKKEGDSKCIDENTENLLSFSSATGSHKYARNDWVLAGKALKEDKLEEVSSIFYEKRSEQATEKAIDHEPATKKRKTASLEQAAAGGEVETTIDEDLYAGLLAQGEELKKVFLTTEFANRDCGLPKGVEFGEGYRKARETGKITRVVQLM
eukprot:g3058.t1